MSSKIKKIKTCDWLLLILTVIILLSSIQLEILSGKQFAWVIFHIIVGLSFLSLIAWHIYLHYGSSSWITKLRTKFAWLSTFYFLTTISAIIALIHWLNDPSHSVIGAVHGKIGFIFLVFVIYHIARRIKFFHPKPDKKQ